MTVEPITVATAADMARVADVPLSSVAQWLAVTHRVPIARHGEDLLYLSSATQALLEEVAE